MALVLSFYGDGPKWENFLYLPAYPAGCSYFRPFRYRDKWVQAPLLDSLRTDRGLLNGRELIIAARFHTSPWEWSLLPIRKGRLDHFSLHEGEDHDIYFSLGSMFDFAKDTPLEEMTARIDEPHRDSVGEAFLFEASLEGSLPTVVDRDGERAAWACLADSLCRTTLPVRDEVRTALFVRIQRPTRGKKTLEPKKLEETQNAGDVYGFSLAEGARYEFTFAHRYPAFIDTDNRMSPVRMQYRVPADVEVTPTDEEVSGNYQTHLFRLAGERRADLSSHIVLDAGVESLPDDSGAMRPVPRLMLPIRIKVGWWYRLRTRWVWFVLMVIGLLASNYVILSTNKNVDSGDLWRLTLSAAIAAAVIFAAQQRSTR
jgi:hypothetical protein